MSQLPRQPRRPYQPSNAGSADATPDSQAPTDPQPDNAPDFEISVSDVLSPEEQPLGQIGDGDRVQRAFTPDVAQTTSATGGEKTSSVGGSPLVARPRSRRRRALAGFSIGAMVALAIGAITLISLPTPQTLGVLLHLPTPTATPVVLPGDTVLYVTRGVYWGHLTIDSRAYTTKALTAGPVSIGIGRHQIIYRARFFPTLRCWLSVPPSKADNCPLIPQAQLDTPNPDFGIARILDLRATFNRLPPAEHQALLGVLAQALGKLTQTSALAPGEHYTTADGQVAVASTPLTASLVPSVPPTQRLYQPNQPDSMRNEDVCDPICDFQGSFGVLLQNWQLAVSLYTTWHFTSPDGQTITPPLRSLSTGERILPFFAWWNDLGGVVTWHVSVATLIVADVECAQGQQQLGDLASQTNISGAALEPLAQSNITQGCLLLYQPPSDTQPLSAAAQVLYHFGVLLAVNDVARHMFPTLPSANASEVATASALYALAKP